MIGGITIESQPAASRTSNSTARRARRPARPAIGVVGRVADRFDQVEGLGRVGIGFQRRLDQGARRAVGDRRRDGLDPVDAFDRAASPPRTSPALRDDDVGQRGRARGEALVEQVLAFDRFDFGRGRCLRWSVRSRRRRSRRRRSAGRAIEPGHHPLRGETATRLPTRAQKPWVASAACSSRWRRIS